jgi:hypothetical protein
MTRSILCLAALTFTQAAFAQPVGEQKPDPLSSAAAALMQIHDRNGDRQLNADECPAIFREKFAAIDLNHDGYLVADELMSALSQRPVRRGRTIANQVYVVADDFVVEVYQNGKKVPLGARGLMREIHGATAERIDIDVHEGDWLVFHVVNNRLRWDGASYFAVSGVYKGQQAFVTNLTAGGWTSNDDPKQADAFIASAEYPFRPVHGIERKWGEGDSIMREMVPAWNGTAVWGESPSTWIKFRAPAPPDNLEESPRP